MYTYICVCVYIYIYIYNRDFHPKNHLLDILDEWFPLFNSWTVDTSTQVKMTK